MQTAPTKLAFTTGVPEAPEWIDDDAREEYARVVQLLAEIPGHLQQVDFSTVITYAQSHSDVKRLTPKVRGHETVSSMTGGMYLNPLCNALAQAHNRMRESGAKLGFSPADRARANAKTETKKKGKANPLDTFIG